MNGKEQLLKELRKKEFKHFLNDKEFLSALIAKTLDIDKKIIETYLKIDEEIDSAYDLETRITETRIKIKTTKYNKIIRYLKEKGKYYKKWYDEEKQVYKIKIYLDKIFEEKYKKLEEAQKNKIEEIFKDEPLTKEDILDLMITELGIRYADKLKISISGII